MGHLINPPTPKRSLFFNCQRVKNNTSPEISIFQGKLIRPGLSINISPLQRLLTHFIVTNNYLITDPTATEYLIS